MSARPEWYHVEGLLMQAVQRSGWTPPGEPLIAGLTDWRELKRGGQGIVYSATQVSTRRRVAVKVVVGGPAPSRIRLQRFAREIDVIAGFQHPHIVRLYDRGLTDQGLPYYVMELIDGCNLEEHLGLDQGFAYSSSSQRGFNHARPVVTSSSSSRSDSRPPPPIDATLRLLAKVCDAVAYAHQQGVVHRDLKPGNILVDRAGEPHVLDFGLAKNVSPGGDGSSAAMSQTGDFLGTLPWASPEQADGVPGRIDARSDVYALGVILFQALTGRLPYPVATLREALENIRRFDPPRPSRLRHVLSAELDAIVLKCLAKEPARRYAHAGELAADLQRYLAGEPIVARGDSTAYRMAKRFRRHRTTLIGGGALLAGIAIALGGVLYPRQRAALTPETGAAAAAVVIDEFGRCQATELVRLRPSDCGAGDEFGFTVAVDGQTAVIGSRWDDDLGYRSGSAYVYESDGANWIQHQKLLPSDGGIRSLFGYAVAVDGDTLVVGAAGMGGAAAYVYGREAGRWIERAKLQPIAQGATPGFGGSVAVRGRVVAGAHHSGQDDDSVAYVFECDTAGTPDDPRDDVWRQSAQLHAVGHRGSNAAMHGIALTDDMLVVGVPAVDQTPEGVYVFRREPDAPDGWIFEALLVPSDPRPEDLYGYTVAADGDLIAVGAKLDGEASRAAGAVYVFRFDGGRWTEEAKLVPWDAIANEQLGYAIAVHGNVIIGGAQDESHAGILCGAAYVFAYDGQSWSGKAKLVASDAAPKALFGCSVAFDGRTALVGAYHENGADFGTAYLFGGLGDCNADGVLDLCSLAAGGCKDHNHNGAPDECEPFPVRLARNTSGQPDHVYVGPPDDVFGSLGMGQVEYDFGRASVVDGPGSDLNVYEFESGALEFAGIDVLVSADGVTWASIRASEGPVVRLPGDGPRGDVREADYMRSYDLAGSGLDAVRFVRIASVDAGPDLGRPGFELDAIGAIHFVP